MRVVTVSVHKGGEGKTTMSKLLAEYSARNGYRTLAIDLDSQCNLSRRFLPMELDPTDPSGVLPPIHPDFNPTDEDWNGRSSVVDFYKNPNIGPTPYPTTIQNLDMVPGYGPLMEELERVRKDEAKEMVLDRLSLMLHTDDVRAAYDVIIIDTAPSKAPLTQSAVRAATDLLIPCQMEPQSLEGLQGMITLWRRENKLRTPLNQIQLLGIVANKVRPSVSLHSDLLEEMRKTKFIAPFVAPIVLGLRTAFAESDHPSAKPKSVFDLQGRSPARQEALAMCEYVFSRLGLHAPVAPAEAA